MSARTDPLLIRLGQPPAAARTDGLSILAETLLEPFVLLTTLWAVAIAFDHSLDAPYLILSLLVFAITCPGRRRNFASVRRLCADILINWLALFVTLMFSIWATRQLGSFRPVVLLAWGFLAPVALIGASLLLRSALPGLTRMQGGPRRCIIVGMNEQGILLARRQAADPLNETRLVGFFDHRPRERLPGCEEFPLLGRLEEIPEFVKRNHIHFVYISLPMTTESRITTLIDGLRNTTASVYFVLDTFIMDIIQGHLGATYGIPMLSVCESPFVGVDGLVKRLFDIVTSGIILLAVSPLMLAIGAAVKLTSPGPVIFRQRRYGLDGEEIMVYKFRSMTVTEDGDQTYKQVEKNDARVTPLGAFLRKTSLDELPQFINVLQGSMSIVGPRPHAIAVNEHYRKRIAGYMIRHKVRPGITGWAQVNGYRGGDDIDSMRSRVEYDLDYLRHWSLGLDLRIIFRTVAVVYHDQRAY